MRLKVIPRKVGVGLKWRHEPSRRKLGWRLAWSGSNKKEASHLFGLRGRHQYSDKRSNQIRATCVASTTVGTERREEPNGQIVSPKKQLMEECKEAGKSLMERKVQGQERILAEHLDGLERSNFCDFDKPHKHACQKAKIESNK